jgi:hypothetical protein
MKAECRRRVDIASVDPSATGFEFRENRRDAIPLSAASRRDEFFDVIGEKTRTFELGKKSKRIIPLSAASRRDGFFRE